MEGSSLVTIRFRVRESQCICFPTMCVTDLCLRISHLQSTRCEAAEFVALPTFTEHQIKGPITADNLFPVNPR